MIEELCSEVKELIGKGAVELEDVERLRELANLGGEPRGAIRAAVEELAPRAEKGDESAAGLLAGCLYALGRMTEARGYLEQIKRTKAGSFCLARCVAELGDYALAAELFEKAFQISPTLTEAQWCRAEALAMIAHPDARKALKELPKDRKRSNDRSFLEGLCLEAEGELGAAIEKYRKILVGNGDHAKTLFRVAYALDLAGEDEEAVAAYERCLEKCGPFANALINLGVLYEDSARFEDAILCYKQILKIDPNNRRARLFLKDAQGSLGMYYDEEAERRQDKRNRVLEIPITDFELSVRSRNCLERINIKTLGDLTRVTERDLLGYKNFGETSLNEIRAILAQKSLRLGQAVEDASQTEEGEAGDDQVSNELLKNSVGELELSLRAQRCMDYLGIGTIGVLIGKSERDLLECKNFGQTSMNEVKQKLASLGLGLSVE